MNFKNLLTSISLITLSSVLVACNSIPSNPTPQQQECLNMRNQIALINAARTNQNQFQINAQRQTLLENYQQNQCYQVLPSN